MVKKKIAFIGTGFIAQICHLPCYAKNEVDTNCCYLRSRYTSTKISCKKI